MVLIQLSWSANTAVLECKYSCLVAVIIGVTLTALCVNNLRVTVIPFFLKTLLYNIDPRCLLRSNGAEVHDDVVYLSFLKILSPKYCTFEFFYYLCRHKHVCNSNN